MPNDKQNNKLAPIHKITISNIHVYANNNMIIVELHQKKICSSYGLTLCMLGIFHAFEVV